jgi:mono/diheme cytochrome c family protein
LRCRRIAGNLALGLVACATLSLTGCRLDMHVQPRYNPYDPSAFFADQRSERSPVLGTVPRDEAIGEVQDAASSGVVDGRAISAFPFPVTRAVLDRGRDRFNIFCAPCHGLGGDGDGVVVQRGFQLPPSYHIDRLRNAPPGYLFGVITNGLGAMYPYGYRIPETDRWAIVAYIRALQLSRHATIDDVPAAERTKLMNETP